MSEWICPLCKLPESQHDKKVEEERKSAISARLARGERGIPKIPDSPDTRHAQAQPPSCAVNTDRELWRETPDDFYAPSVHVTTGGGIGIDVGGLVFVMPLREWHKLAVAAARPAEQPAPPLDALTSFKPLYPNLSHTPESEAAAEPSAPPQPARYCGFCGKNTCIEKECLKTAPPGPPTPPMYSQCCGVAFNPPRPMHTRECSANRATAREIWESLTKEQQNG